jgi:DNA modification methylase
MGRANIAISKLEEAALRLQRYDACFCDPPYGLEFMGKDWDRGVPGPRLWQVVFDALKPGAWVMAFGGTRTYHRLTCAIEDAGFQIEDCLMWLYGSGFPKGLDISKGIDRRRGAKREARRYAPRPATCGSFTGKGTTAPWIEQGKAQGFYDAAGPIPITEEAQRWEGYKSCLKPAWEPIILAQKPFEEGGFVESALERGVGGLNIDGCRIGSSGGARYDPDDRTGHTWAEHAAAQRAGVKTPNVNVYGPGAAHLNAIRSPKVEGLGRYPSNVILDPTSARMVDAQSGITKSAGSGRTRLMPGTRFYKPNLYGGVGGQITPGNQHRDQGGASRFYYVAKAGPKERGNNPHPTVKPVRLCEYLARLILPPEQPDHTRRLLVPFSGSGSEMIGGLRAGWDEVTGVEMDGEYAITAFTRIEEAGHEVRLL